MGSDPFGRQPAPGFDDPIGVLRACHRRMERQLATLDRLRKHLPAHHADDDARAAASAIMRYFDSAAPHHHADEEASLWPRLVAADPAVARIADALTREHTALESRWRRLRPLLAAIVARSSGHLPVKGVGEFCAAYAAHIDREEALVLTRAAKVLDAAALAAIGGEMAERRELRNS
jgi:hemerythrin-like domain-containing protein